MANKAPPFVPTKFFPTFKQKKTCEADFEKYVKLCAKKDHEDSVARLVYVFDEIRTRVSDQLNNCYIGGTAYNVNAEMEPKKTVLDYIGLLEGLSTLELRDTDEEAMEKGQKQEESEKENKDADLVDDGKEDKKEVKKEDDKKEDDKKAPKAKKAKKNDNAPFRRTPATMLGFRWSNLVCHEGKFFRNVNVWHEEASVLLALLVCVTNQATKEQKNGSPADYGNATKTALAAAGIADAALTAFKASKIQVTPPGDIAGGTLLQAFLKYNLALAQEMLVHRCFKQGQSPGLVASLCTDAAARYDKVSPEVTNITSTPSKTMKCLSDYSKVKTKYMSALGYFCLGRKRSAQENKEGCVLAIKDFERAVELADEAEVLATKSELKHLQQTASELKASASSMQASLDHQIGINDSVYFALIPDTADAPAEAKSLVEGRQTSFAGEAGFQKHPLFADQNLATCFVPTKSKFLPGECDGQPEKDDGTCVLL